MGRKKGGREDGRQRPTEGMNNTGEEAAREERKLRRNSGRHDGTVDGTMEQRKI